VMGSAGTHIVRDRVEGELNRELALAAG